MNQMKQAFLSALEQRTTRTCSSQKTTLPTGVVRNNELHKVLRALDAANNDTDQEDDN